MKVSTSLRGRWVRSFPDGRGEIRHLRRRGGRTGAVPRTSRPGASTATDCQDTGDAEHPGIQGYRTQRCCVAVGACRVATRWTEASWRSGSPSSNLRGSFGVGTTGTGVHCKKMIPHCQEVWAAGPLESLRGSKKSNYRVYHSH